MTQTPPTLRAKYPKAKYAPRVGCQYCKGKGEVNGKAGLKPCICLFVTHENIEMSLKVLPLALIETMGIDLDALEGKVK